MPIVPIQPLQTDCTQIRPDILSYLIWIQSVWHLDDIPEIIFWKVDFDKNQQMTKKHEKFPRRQSLLTMSFGNWIFV